MECVCNELRKNTRSITNAYDKLLAPSGIRVTQFSLLRALKNNKALSLGDLAKKMQLDQTSTTRSVSSLESAGLIERAKHGDPRVKMLQLTAQGKTSLKQAERCWQKAQSKILGSVTLKQWEDALAVIEKFTVEAEKITTTV